MIWEIILGKEWVPYGIAQANGDDVSNAPHPEELGNFALPDRRGLKDGV